MGARKREPWGLSSFLCDTNVWVALAISKHVHHMGARAWFEAVFEPGSVLFCRATQQSFLRLMTSAAVFAPYGSPPLTNEKAWETYERLLADDRIVFIEEPDGLDRVWRELSGRPTVSPRLWMDAYLAAFAHAAGCRLVTTDIAFRQFQGLDLLLLGRTPAA